MNTVSQLDLTTEELTFKCTWNIHQSILGLRTNLKKCQRLRNPHDIFSDTTGIKYLEIPKYLDIKYTFEKHFCMGQSRNHKRS